MDRLIELDNTRRYRLTDSIEVEKDTEVVQVKLDEYANENTRPFNSEDKILTDKAIGTRSLDLTTILKFNLRVLNPNQSESSQKDNITLCWPWYNNYTDKELIGLKREQIIKSKDSNPVTYCLKDGRSGLFGWNMINSKSKTVVLTAREVDVIALVQDCKVTKFVIPQFNIVIRKFKTYHKF
ncbi:Twinkle protein, mitochondrial-like isoform X1 [Oopsacas minuta]|uniref:Twinkle protein, mitochondrial-like isoform X1 n=1 Tax=Oopsacas minuta TaxID=111878 RepID=A0AAV7K0U1_9METZ|nr:Twinkle protein, mitochondrial-like isoform X1 [Oopsacas minuta]